MTRAPPALSFRRPLDGAGALPTPSPELLLISGPTASRRWIKNNIYGHLPMKWLFRFLYMYVWRLGILDGVNGFRFCLFISSYEMLIGLQIVDQLRQAEESPPKPPATGTAETSDRKHCRRVASAAGLVNRRRSCVPADP